MPLNKAKNEKETYEVTTNPDYKTYEINWDKVQVVGDLKVILQAMNVQFSDMAIKGSKDPIINYLKNYTGKYAK